MKLPIKNNNKSSVFLAILLLLFVVISCWITLRGNWFHSESSSVVRNIGSVLGIETKQTMLQKSIQSKMIREANKLLGVEPNPIAKISTEGKLDSDPLKIRSVESLLDSKKFYYLAYAYSITNNSNYFDNARKLLVAWADVYKASGNSIDETQLLPFMEGYFWIKDDLINADREHINQWLSSIAYRQMQVRFDDERDYSNWNSHRINIIGQVGYATNDKKLIDYAIVEFKKQIKNNLNPDGSSYDSVTRDSLSYHCYNLLPLLSLAKASTLYGNSSENLYEYVSPTNSSLKKSIEYLYPYVDGSKSHREFVNSKSDWDKKTAKSGQARSVIGRLFKPSETIETLQLAYFFDERTLPYIQAILNNNTAYPSFEIMLNSEQKSSKMRFDLGTFTKVVF